MKMTIALWCVLLMGMMPVICVAFAKIGASYDNNNPRDYAQNLTGYRRRAYAAHHNAYETFPFFAAAVIVAQMTLISASQQGLLNTCAMVFVGLRVGYFVFYLMDKPTLRSIMWALGWFLTIGIFTSSLWMR
jgi:uncharacterized MAPEG superfamily protein